MQYVEARKKVYVPFYHAYMEGCESLKLLKKHVEDGGMYGGPREWMRPAEVGHPLDKGQHKYRHWLYSAFWVADWNALSGKPASFLAQWRTVTPTSDKAAE